MWGPTTAASRGVPDAVGAVALTGALAATFGGAGRRAGVARATVLVGHKWVAVLVVLVLLTGTAMVVGGAGTVVGEGTAVVVKRAAVPTQPSVPPVWYSGGDDSEK